MDLIGLIHQRVAQSTGGLTQHQWDQVRTELDTILEDLTVSNLPVVLTLIIRLMVNLPQNRELEGQFLQQPARIQLALDRILFILMSSQQ